MEEEKKVLTPDEIAAKIAQDLKERKAAEKPKRGKKLTEEETQQQKYDELLELVEFDKKTVEMAVLAAVKIIQTNTIGWSEVEKDELDSLTNSTYVYLQVRAKFLIKFAPEIMLIMAWGGYLIPRMIERKKQKLAEEPKVEVEKKDE